MPTSREEQADQSQKRPTNWMATITTSLSEGRFVAWVIQSLVLRLQVSPTCRTGKQYTPKGRRGNSTHQTGTTRGYSQVACMLGQRHDKVVEASGFSMLQTRLFVYST